MASTKPQQRAKEERERLRGERDQIKKNSVQEKFLSRVEITVVG